MSRDNFSRFIIDDDDDQDDNNKYEYIEHNGMRMRKDILNNFNFDHIDPQKRSLTQFLVYSDLLGLWDEGEEDNEKNKELKIYIQQFFTIIDEVKKITIDDAADALQVTTYLDSISREISKLTPIYLRLEELRIDTKVKESLRNITNKILTIYHTLIYHTLI